LDFSLSIFLTINRSHNFMPANFSTSVVGTNGHEADLTFGRGLPHKIKNFGETWGENAQPIILILDTSGNVLALHHESGKCIYFVRVTFSTMDIATHHLLFLDLSQYHKYNDLFQGVWDEPTPEYQTVLFFSTLQYLHH